MVIACVITILFTFIELLINATYLLICGITVAVISLFVYLTSEQKSTLHKTH